MKWFFDIDTSKMRPATKEEREGINNWINEHSVVVAPISDTIIDYMAYQARYLRLAALDLSVNQRDKVINTLKAAALSYLRREEKDNE